MQPSCIEIFCPVILSSLAIYSTKVIMSGVMWIAVKSALATNSVVALSITMWPPCLEAEY